MTVPSSDCIDCVLVSALADNQLAIWYDQLARSSSPVYNIGGRLAIYGELNYALLKQALELLVAQNAALRISVIQSGDQVLQTIRPHLPVELPFIDFSHKANPESLVAEWLNDRFKQAFPIGESSIYWQFALLKISNRQYALLTKYHHLIADGWSTKIVIDRLAELYNALLKGGVPPLPETSDYLDYVAQEDRYLNSKTFTNDAVFWQHALPALPESLIRRKYAGNSRLQETRANLHRFSLNRLFYDRLQEWAGEQHSSIYHVLLSALSAYFARAHQQHRITVGLPALNRSGARFKKVVGMFASLSPLVIDIDTEITAQEFLRRISLAVRRVHKHQRYPLSALHQRLQLLKNHRESLFDLVLSFEKQEYAVRFGEATVHARQLFSGFALYPLAVTVCEFNAADDIEVIFEGAETCFNKVELELLAQRFQWILQQFMDSSALLLRDLDLIPAAEKQFIFQRFNSPTRSSHFISVISQFSAWVDKTPEAIAVSQQGRSVTYRMLDRLSDQLGRQLQQLRLSTGALVAVCMPRCIEAMVSFLAILKIRAVYLPIDVDSPHDRIEAILQQSGTAVVLTVCSEVRVSKMHRSCIFVDQLDTAKLPGKLVWVEPEAEESAYVIYTSGSTGQPKGVKIHHRALSLRLRWLQNAFAIQNHERVGQTIQTHFDPSLIEMGLALTQGAELVLAPHQRLMADELADFVLSEKINALALVPSSLRLLMQGLPASGDIPLRVACCGGETLPPGLAKAFIARTGAQLFNVYGPTETTILATAWPCSINDPAVLPIGQPLDDTRILIVDRQLKLLPLAVPGEIVIGGAGVGKGYLRQEEVSRQVFVDDAYGEGANEYLYRTGDQGYIGTDGQLYFAERLDRQVKISGYRSGPAEIECLLLQHPIVAGAAVVAVEIHGQKRLVAYVAAITNQPDSLRAELSTFLRGRAPDYMQPRRISVLNSLPVTSNGKVAYDRLPKLEQVTRCDSQRGPISELESQLLAIWRETLKNPSLGVEDNFFEQDTDSITAIGLIAAIEKMTGFRQSIAFLMAYPTVAEQVEQLNQVAVHKPPCCATLSTKKPQVNFYLAASGYGDQMRFQALADVLSEHCTLHVLYPPSLAAELVSIETIASHYAQVIRVNAPQLFYLGGFSIGGVTALETARQLEQQGFPPMKLILLDTIYPRWPLKSAWLFKTLQGLSGLWGLNEISLNGRKLRAMLTDTGIIQQLTGLSQHSIRPYSGRTLLVMSKRMGGAKRWLFSGWDGLFGSQLTIDYVPGLHGAMFSSRYLPILSQVIKRGLQMT
ncbi:MAG: amino acid adenylation domain-containing protein [Methylomonas sp.]|jgi:non-ribosomal peptide synthetase component F/acyl carrier protein|uniref:non-ribosomal peptide synthetase n=1 Tax=Methylomonas sp. TaxID=418 RepID=UPI0025FE2677|nr:amino acid adenylation domain-containing protein [Methylomonas sp.]MCK9604957.1 amino acid adenylation domain-containing protein [Methylomonas sp.]